MGKIADAIEEVEDELAQVKDDLEALTTSYNDMIQQNDALEERVTQLAKIVEQYNAMEDYMEEYHPGIVTAFEVANRMEK